MSCNDLFKKINILFVEDEHRLAYLLRDAVGHYFKEFNLAHDGKEGLKMAIKIDPDIIITDITMPEMNGLEMSAKLREKHPELPIVILSAYSEKEYLIEAIDVGVTKYLIKPFDPDELLETICNMASKLKWESSIDLMPPFRFDLEEKKLFNNKSMVKLSKRENLFIYLLLNNSNYFMTPEEIKDGLWDEDIVSDERLRVFINRLRRKTDSDLISNIIGQGYVLNTKGAHR